MPEISLFYGIRITMYYDDHNPPHFQAEYNGNKAIIDINECTGYKRCIAFKAVKAHTCMVRNSSR